MEMRERLLRTILLAVSVYILLNDLQEIATLFNRRIERGPVQVPVDNSNAAVVVRQNGQTQSKAQVVFELVKSKLMTLFSNSWNGNGRGGQGTSDGQYSTTTTTQGQIMENELIRYKEEQESKVIDWIDVMKKHCLPKLICELYANLNGFTTPTDVEQNLLNIIKETSLSTNAAAGATGLSVSTYHFAAHIGQLLNSVEGNGCYNFYTQCPISKFNVLKLIRNVRIK